MATDNSRRSILLPVRSVAEVAAAMGLSRAQVMRLETRALLKTRAALEARGLGYRELLALISPPKD
jgi:hypothetical protein